VVGLQGTGSHDYQVEELFVPAQRTMSLADHGWAAGTSSRLPIFSYLLSGMAAVPLGLARAAIDDLVGLAVDKTPSRSSRRLADRDTTQGMVGRAEAAVQSARAFLRDAVEDLWDTACREETITMRHRALVRLAAVNAHRACADAVDLCFVVGGGTSVYEASILQRAFRDVNTAGQHIALAYTGYETVGRVLLGMDPDTALL
jgi:indole-3-acetate monooxygenase